MSNLSLRRFDVQANVGVVLSAGALVLAGAATYAVWTRYNPEMRAIPYGSKSWLYPAILACVASSLVLAFVGTALGANSAGQRRNERQGRSWLAFLLGLTAVVLAALSGYAFWTLKVAAA